MDIRDAYRRLTRDEVAAAIERRNPPRVPMVGTHWWGEGLWEQYGERLNPLAEKYPRDAYWFIDLPGLDVPRESMSWYRKEDYEGKGHDAAGVLTDWQYLDEYLEKMPERNAQGLFDKQIEQAERARAAGRYVLAGWWGLFFERPWGLRGMANLLLDYYTEPEKVHRLHRGLCDQYKALLERAAREIKPDGFWTSDDLGNQRNLMMSPEQFREFLKPYYKEVGDACKKGGIHFWLHSCGNNTPILGDLAEAGLDVFHPVQKHTMDEKAVAKAYGDRLTFLVGFDVQHILQEGTPEEVRAEVRHLVDTFDRPDGGMMMAAGNGIVRGTPLENIEAYLDETVRYGAAHRARW